MKPLKNNLKSMAKDVFAEVEDNARLTLEQQVRKREQALTGAVQARMDRVVQRATIQETLDKFAGIDEEEILTYVPDKRDFSGIGPALLGLVILIMFPGWLKSLSILFFASGVFFFWLRYINAAKVDVPDGYKGVVCRFGSPMSQGEATAQTGRNWYFNYAQYIPYLVSSRDQVVNLKNANFTWDFGSIALSNQVVFRVENPARFIARTTPAGIMKMLNIYASYITLRMITSMQDARVKFVGRDRIDNVVNALNQYLAEPYGIRVMRANMPSAENDIISDLEIIRTRLKTIEALSEDKMVKLESAIKEVESAMRKARKETRSRALELQHAKISMETRIAEEVNTTRQSMLIDARRHLEEQISLLKREIASVRAKLEKAKTIQQSFHGLQAQLDLRQARIKRELFQQMIPEQVSVLDIEGIGAGVGLSMGQQLFQAMHDQTTAPHPDGNQRAVSAESVAESLRTSS